MNRRFSSRVVSYLAKLMMIRGNIHHFWCEMILIRNFWRKWNLDLVRAISAQLGKHLKVEPKGVHDDSIAVLEPSKHQETCTPSGAVNNIDVWCTRGRGSWWLLDRRSPFPPLQELLHNWSTDHVFSSTLGVGVPGKSKRFRTHDLSSHSELKWLISSEAYTFQNKLTEQVCSSA